MSSSPIAISAAQQVELRSAAKKAAQQAYAPYSGFRVGAALRLETGEIVSAANVENTSYGLSICAERSAVVCAVAQHGPRIRIVAVAVANVGDQPCSPCGACRQVMAEFMPPDGLILFAFDGAPQVLKLADLLPFGFSLAHAE